MSVRTSHRISAGLAPLIAAGLVLSGCGGSDGEAATRPTVTLDAGETAYATLPPATNPETDTEEPEEEAEGADAADAQEYTVKSGDYGYKVAADFGVSLEELEDANGWSDAGSEFPKPGAVIMIPAGAKSPSASSGSDDTSTPADTDTDTGGDSQGTGGDPAVDTDGASDEPEDSGDTGEAIPEVGGNCEAGSYVIEDDVRTRFEVAEKFDVTVEAMDQANASTNGYDAFYPGLKIVIPAKDDC